MNTQNRSSADRNSSSCLQAKISTTYSGNIPSETENLFRQMMDNIRAVFWVVELDFSRMIYVSPSYEDIWGHSCDELYVNPRTWTNSVHPDDMARLKESILERKDLTFSLEYRIIRPDGTIRWIHDRGFPVRNASGEIYRLAGIAEDVTDRKLADEALLRSETRYRAMVENQTELVCRWLPDTTLTYVNNACAAFFGKRPDQLINTQWASSQYYPPAESEARMAYVQELIQNPRVNTDDQWFDCPDGTRKWINWTNCPIFDDQGRLIEFQSVGRNITERKIADERLKVLATELEEKVRQRTWELQESNDSLFHQMQQRQRIENALRESEEKYRTIVENTLEVIMLTAPDGTVLYLSPSCREVLGYDPEDLVGRQPWIIHPDDLAKAQETFRKALAAESGSNFNYRIQTRTGQIRWISHSWKPLMNNSQLKMVVSVIRDITKLRHAEEVLKQTERLAASGRMAARLAHELNNPLAGIKNSFQLIKNAIPSDHPYFQYVGRIEKEINRIANIVRQTFDLYRPDHDIKSEFMIAESIRDVVSLLEPTCREHNVTIRMDMPNPDAVINLSEGLVRQVLFNVIKNAVEASFPGGVVRVEARVKPENLVIAVCDTGTGIAPEAHPRIFESFFTTKTRQKTTGLGLGLSICKNIIESMNGTIDFTSEPGRGTEFHIGLPMGETRGKVNHV